MHKPQNRIQVGLENLHRWSLVPQFAVAFPQVFQRGKVQLHEWKLLVVLKTPKILSPQKFIGLGKGFQLRPQNLDGVFGYILFQLYEKVGLEGSGNTDRLSVLGATKDTDEVLPGFIVVFVSAVSGLPRESLKDYHCFVL